MDHREDKVTNQPFKPLQGCHVMMHLIGRSSWLLFTLLTYENVLMKMKLANLKCPGPGELDVVSPLLGLTQKAPARLADIGFKVMTI